MAPRLSKVCEKVLGSFADVVCLAQSFSSRGARGFSERFRSFSIEGKTALVFPSGFSRTRIGWQFFVVAVLPV